MIVDKRNVGRNSYILKYENDKIGIATGRGLNGKYFGKKNSKINEWNIKYKYRIHYLWNYYCPSLFDNKYKCNNKCNFIHNFVTNCQSFIPLKYNNNNNNMKNINSNICQSFKMFLQFRKNNFSDIDNSLIKRLNFNLILSSSNTSDFIISPKNPNINNPIVSFFFPRVLFRFFWCCFLFLLYCVVLYYLWLES